MQHADADLVLQFVVTGNDLEIVTVKSRDDLVAVSLSGRPAIEIIAALRDLVAVATR